MLSVLVTVSVVDLVAFVLLDARAPGYRPERFFQFSPLLGWFHRPSSEGTWYRYRDGTRYHVSINRYGFADSERDVQKTRPRIALIGDSTTEFWEADAPDRGQYVMEELLHHELEVLNLGVRGYGTDQTYLLFKAVGARFSPDIVVYTFCINDFWNNVDTRVKPHFEIDPDDPTHTLLRGYPIEFEPTSHLGDAHDLLEDYSFVYRKITHWLEVREARREPPDLETQFELRPYKEVYDQEDTRRLEITTRVIDLLDAYVRSQGMKLLVVEGLYGPASSPAQQQEIVRLYGPHFDFGKVSRILESHTSARGIAFLSLPLQLQDGALDVEELMHPSDNMHLNKAGILFYARAVVDKLRSLGWLHDQDSWKGVR